MNTHAFEPVWRNMTPPFPIREATQGVLANETGHLTSASDRKACEAALEILRRLTSDNCADGNSYAVAGSFDSNRDGFACGQGVCEC